uniref:Molybdopterin synthase catalytic subunit n=2 Tax=Macrostomum lignano TaxID=282301 RepID=A0A1I8GKF3_9PLAT
FQPWQPPGDQLIKMNFVEVTPEPLSLDRIHQLVVDPTCGAVCHFVGTTRDSFEGREVVRLEYEAYEEMARKEMLAICLQARQRWSCLRHLAIYHRTGLVPVGEASIIIAVSSPHRSEAIKAVEFAINAAKATVPVWKKEIYAGDQPPQWKVNAECQWAGTAAASAGADKPASPGEAASSAGGARPANGHA